MIEAGVGVEVGLDVEVTAGIDVLVDVRIFIGTAGSGKVEAGVAVRAGVQPENTPLKQAAITRIVMKR
jgi:hypothetical protein